MQTATHAIKPCLKNAEVWNFSVANLDHYHLEC